MTIRVLDRTTAKREARRLLPHSMIAAPGGADSGHCGICGEPVGQDAPRGVHVIPQTEIAFEIALCANHAEEAQP